MVGQREELVRQVGEAEELRRLLVMQEEGGKAGIQKAHEEVGVRVDRSTGGSRL